MYVICTRFDKQTENESHNPISKILHEMTSNVYTSHPVGLSGVTASCFGTVNFHYFKNLMLFPKGWHVAQLLGVHTSRQSVQVCPLWYSDIAQMNILHLIIFHQNLALSALNFS